MNSSINEWDIPFAVHCSDEGTEVFLRHIDSQSVKEIPCGTFEINADNHKLIARLAGAYSYCRVQQDFDRKAMPSDKYGYFISNGVVQITRNGAPLLDLPCYKLHMNPAVAGQLEDLFIDLVDLFHVILQTDEGLRMMEDAS